VHDCELWQVSDADLARVSPLLTPDVREVLTVQGALGARSAFGGTAPARVAEQLAALRDIVAADVAWAVPR
jgi:argininosuccinate lyase